jgi:transposase
VAAKAIGKQKVHLGERVKQFVVYGSIVLRLSYEQLRCLLRDMANLHLSDGEISVILQQQGELVRPRYEELEEQINEQEGAHYDETSWKVQGGEQGNHGWVKTGTKGEETIFLLGRSRGKGNAEELQGGNKEQVGVSDDYGVYKNLFKKHQLCWAHPHRKLRELAESEHLEEKTHARCEQVYQSFSALYAQVRILLDEPFILAERKVKKQKLVQVFQHLAVTHRKDPPKLQKILERLKERQEAYFTCITTPGIPADNNKAERALRHLVLKRKNSYGSKSQKSADVLGMLYSVVLSLWWKKPLCFFQEYAQLLQPSS